MYLYSIHSVVYLCIVVCYNIQNIIPKYKKNSLDIWAQKYNTVHNKCFMIQTSSFKLS